MVDFETSTSKSSRRNPASSSSCRSGFPRSISFNASTITGVMIRDRPTEAVGGALGLPKARTFERIALTERLLQPATFAIWLALRLPAWIIAWICSRCAVARFGAMLARWGGGNDIGRDARGGIGQSKCERVGLSMAWRNRTNGQCAHHSHRVPQGRGSPSLCRTRPDLEKVVVQSSA